MEASPGFTPLSGTCLKCYSSSCFLSSKLVSEAFQTTLATCTHRNEPIADLSLDDTHINPLGATWVDRQMQRHSRKTSKEHFQDRRKELCSSWICRKLEHLFQVKGWKWLSFQWKVVLQLCKDKQRGVFIWAGTSVSFLGVIYEKLAHWSVTFFDALAAQTSQSYLWGNTKPLCVAFHDLLDME